MPDASAAGRELTVEDWLGDRRELSVGSAPPRTSRRTRTTTRAGRPP
ncbi:hypothetical protein ACR6C2_14935 [Streptomyces sp. INA 01156]